MPAGFEFGPNGGKVRRLVEKLAQVPQRPPTKHQGNPDYEIAMTFLEDQCFQTERLHDSRVALATAYLDCLASRSHTGPIGRCNRHLPASTPVSTLLNSAVAGLPIPDVVAQRWYLAPDHEARHTLRPNGSLGVSTAGRRYRRGRVHAVPRGRHN
jgi:hypothetical protein